MLENVSIIIPIAPNETAQEVLLNDLKDTKAEIILSSEGSRAKSLNAGAVKAQRQFLWFLHADSRTSNDNLIKLEQSLEQHPNALHYFDLAFDGKGLITLNAWGANIRSGILGLPYGDQGLCISKAQFARIGLYSENHSYGEDLLFVRKAKKAGMKFTRIPSPLKTNTRKYKEHGWLKTTLLHQWLLFKLLRAKI